MLLCSLFLFHFTLFRVSNPQSLSPPNSRVIFFPPGPRRSRPFLRRKVSGWIPGGHEHDRKPHRSNSYQNQPSPKYSGLNGHFRNYGAHGTKRTYEFQKVSADRCACCFLPVCARGAVVSDEAPELPARRTPRTRAGRLQDEKYRFKYGRDLIEANLLYLIAFFSNRQRASRACEVRLASCEVAFVLLSLGTSAQIQLAFAPYSPVAGNAPRARTKTVQPHS